MAHIQRFNEEFDDYIETVTRYINSHKEYKNMDVDDVIEELKKEKLLKNYIQNNSDKVREYLQKRKDSITNSGNSDTITWDDLLEDMKRDIGEYTDIKTRDFRFISKWLENKIVGKNIVK